MWRTAPSDRKVYADYASFSPIDEEVLLAMQQYYGAHYGNPSSLHQAGRNASFALREARERVARTLSSKKEEIVFTGSGTEANNLALFGVAKKYRPRGNHIIVSAIEHPSILESAKKLEAWGWKVSYAPVLSSGVLDIDACMSLVTDETILISVMHVNNEVGTVQPIKELCARVRAIPEKIRPLVHTDACQSANLFSLSPESLGVDLMTLNSTKVSGPSGVGCLYKREGVDLDPLYFGGEQEYKLRPGTENVPAIVGFSLALEKAQKAHRAEYARLQELRKFFVEGLKNKIPTIHINGNLETQSPGIVHVTVPRIEGEAMLLLLDDRGICVSTGSACASANISASHVLLAIGQDPDTIHGSLRFSFGKDTTKDDIEYILEMFPAITEWLCSMTALKETTV